MLKIALWNYAVPGFECDKLGKHCIFFCMDLQLENLCFNE